MAFNLSFFGPEDLVQQKTDLDNQLSKLRSQEAELFAQLDSLKVAKFLIFIFFRDAHLFSKA
jgi:hypothetical protein